MANLDITKMSLPELKAFAYDNICQLNMYQNNVKLLEAEMAKREKGEVPVQAVEGEVVPTNA